MKCREKAESRNLKQNLNKRKLMILSEFAVSNNKKSRFIKEQETSGLSSSLRIKAPLSQIPLVCLILFYRRYKVNEI